MIEYLPINLQMNNSYKYLFFKFICIYITYINVFIASFYKAINIFKSIFFLNSVFVVVLTLIVDNLQANIDKKK